MKMKTWLLWIGISLIGTICLVPMIHKPSRVLMPQLFGLSCPTDHICLDDLDRLDEARRLTNDAMEYVADTLVPFEKRPRVLFCSTQECFRQFGNPAIAAQNVTTVGIVINELGWSDYILRHEMIHHVQNEVFGAANASYLLPRWFIEGMAYTLSEDPRRPLPRTDIEGYRTEYEAWIAEGRTWRDVPKGL
jgi:hypothetical protein